MTILTEKAYEFIKKISSSPDLTALNLVLKNYLSALDIHSYSYSHYTYHPRAKQKLKYEHSSAHFKAWHQHYLTEQYEEIDTTLHASYLTTEPFVWMLSEQLAQAKSKREKQMRMDSIQYGIIGGISVPIHGPNNDFAHLIAVEVKNEAKFLEKANELMPALNLLAHYYYNAVLHLLPKQAADKTSLFTQRELSCLTLVAKHLSVDDIAKKLNITSRTVHFHIQNTNKKLGVANKFDAVNKALEMGLIVL